MNRIRSFALNTAARSWRARPAIRPRLAPPSAIASPSSAIASHPILAIRSTIGFHSSVMAHDLGGGGLGDWFNSMSGGLASRVEEKRANMGREAQAKQFKQMA